MAATSRSTYATGGESSSGKPKRLRPWLENLLNQNEIPGLCWVDSNKTMFKIPWKHRGKQDWSPDHSRIFKEWAVQTGRFQDGQPEDYPTWKTRLRCAFNKAPDIEEVREKRCIDSSEPYRIYRFKPATPTITPGSSGAASRGHGVLPAHSATDFDDVFNQIGAEIAESNQCDEELAMNRLDRTARWCLQLPELDTCEAAMAAYGVDLSSTQYNNTQKRIKLDSSPDDFEKKIQGPMFSASASPNAFGISPAAGQKLPQLTGKALLLKCDADIKPNIATTHCAAVCAVDNRPQDQSGEFKVIVRYCGRTVVERVVNSPTGCFICFNPISLSRLLAPEDAELIMLPACTSDDKFPPKEEGKIQSVMNELLKRGLAQPLFIRCVGQNIYVHRTCQCATYYYKQEVRSFAARAQSIRQPIKIRRTIIGQPETDALTCVFDHECYVSELKDYLDERGRKPDPYCRLVFGQELPYDRVDETGALITVLVATTRALEDLSKAEAAMAQRTPDIHFSNSTDIDRLMHDIGEMEFNGSLEQSQQMEAVPYYFDSTLLLNEMMNVQYSPNDDLPENQTTSFGTVPTTTASVEACSTAFTFNHTSCAIDVTAEISQ